MKTIVTTMDYLTASDAKEIESLSKTDKFIILYDQDMKVPAPICVGLSKSAVIPTYVEMPDFSLLLFHLGTLLSGLSGEVLFLSEEDTIKKLDGYVFGKATIKVCSSFSGEVKKVRKPRTKKEIEDIPNTEIKSKPIKKAENKQEKLIEKEVEKRVSVKAMMTNKSFEAQLKALSSKELNLITYKDIIKEAIANATDPIGLEIQINIRAGKEIGPKIYALISPEYKSLKSSLSKE